MRAVDARTQRYAATRFVSLVLATVVICIEKLFEPLQKLKVVLKAPFYQLVHWYYLNHFHGVSKYNIVHIASHKSIIYRIRGII